MRIPVLARGCAVACASTLAFASSALAADTNSFEKTHIDLSAGSTHTVHTAMGTGMIVRTIVGLLIVIAVIYGLTWVVKQTKRSGADAEGSGLEQVASLPLGNGRSVALVRVGHELHLVGVSEQAVTGIARFTEDEAADLGLPVRGPGEGPSGETDDRGNVSIAFARVVGNLLGNRKSEDPRSVPDADAFAQAIAALPPATVAGAPVAPVVAAPSAAAPSAPVAPIFAPAPAESAGAPTGTDPLLALRRITARS